MESKRIIPQGIIRNTPNQATVDEALLDASNVRFLDGAWRQVGTKVQARLFITTGSSTVVYHHPESGKYICLVYRSSTWVVEAHTASDTGGSYVTIFTIGTITSAKITHIGNFIYISRSTDPASYILYWNDFTQAYVRLEQLPALEFAAWTWDNKTIECKVDLTGLDTDTERYNATSGEFLRIISEQREQGFFNGHIMLRYAYKLFDGSYIMHSEPFYVRGGFANDATGVLANFKYEYESASNSGLIHQHYAMSGPTSYFALDRLKLFINATGINTQLQPYVDCSLIRSVCVFATSIVEGYTVPETFGGLTTSSMLPIDKTAIENLADPASMWLLKEWGINELLAAEVAFVVPSLKDIELAEAISPDNFTHHTIIPTNLFTINKKIHGCSLTTNLSGFPANLFRQYFSSAYPTVIANTDILSLITNQYSTKATIPAGFEYYATVELLTDDGLKRKPVQLTDGFYSGTFGTALLFNPVITYPDIRAKNIVVWVKRIIGNITNRITTIPLTASNNGNYAYYRNGFVPSIYAPEYSLLQCFSLQVPSNDTAFFLLPSYTDNSIFNDRIHDYNRVQVSKLTNPFVWDANNSYRFGSEKNTVIALSTAQEPITETVFGMFPVIVFTSQGIFALERGTGDVMYSNISELNKEVLSNPDGVYGITGAVLFVTAYGLKLLQGRQVIELSTNAEGDTGNKLIANAYYLAEINPDASIHAPVVETFQSYMQGSFMALSTIYNELMVCKPTESYSYVYNFDNKTWHTITESFTSLVGGKLFKAGKFYSVDLESGSPAYLIQSRPFSLGSDGSKKINYALARSTRDVLVDTYDQIVFFGSNDCETWATIGGVQVHPDTIGMVIRNCAGYYKYITYVIKGAGENFTLTAVDLQFTLRYNDKLR